MKKLVFLLILTLVLFPLISIIWEKKDYYLSPFDLNRAQTLYGISQYVKEKDAAWIADEILFAYAGWYYIDGGNPILVNPENPPLGKYIVGASIKFFNNEKLPSLIFGLLSLFALFLLAREFLKEKWLALLPVTLFSWQKIFQEQLLYVPLFETFALTFLTLGFYFLIKAEKEWRYFLLTNFFLGALWATRPWMATVPLIASWVGYLLLRKEFKNLYFLILTIPMAFIVLLLSYWRLFFEGWGVYKILSIQKWILWYHQSRLINFGSVWEFIYLGRWRVWWGDKPYLPVNQWTISWPIFTTLALIFSFLVLAKISRIKEKRLQDFKFDKRIAALCLWVIFYLLFLSFGNINSRYIFYLLPFCYVLGIYLLILVKRRIF